MKAEKFPLAVNQKGVSAVIRKVDKVKSGKTLNYFIVEYSFRYTTFKYFDPKLIPASSTDEIVTAQFEIENIARSAARKWRSFLSTKKIPV